MDMLRYELPYDPKLQLQILLDALIAIAPYSRIAGISMKDRERYDEWENILDVFFNSFLVSPVVNTCNYFSSQDFARIGFKYIESKKVFFGGKLLERTYVISDISTINEIEFRYVFTSPNHQKNDSEGGVELSELTDIGLYR